MSLAQINRLLNPKSVAVIGASNKSTKAGYLAMRNLLQAKFSGPIMPVNPTYHAVCGVLAYSDVSKLPMVPDLAIISLQANKVREVIIQLGEMGCANAIVLASGMELLPDINGLSAREELLQTAKQYNIRILGASSLGMQIPRIGLNASFAHKQALPGKIAFISQSSAISTTMLDWACHKGVGFSHFISLGDTLDVNFGELLDYLGRDPKTQSILLYIDSIADHRRFMSAARSAARFKPLLVIKSGRTNEGAHGVELHTGSSNGSDIVYDAAFRRAGMLRVKDLHELFAAFETLAHAKPMVGERLAIITNGGAPAIMAVDALIERGGKLASLEPEIMAELDKLLPPFWSKNNPVDVLGDATPKRFAQAVKILLRSKAFDSLLILHSPSAVAEGQEYAEAILEAIKEYKPNQRPNILTNWTGEEAAFSARKCFSREGIATYRTPEGAVGAFMHMIEYRRNQKLLMETPQSIPDEVPTNPQLVRRLAQENLQKGLSTLDIHQAAEILQAYGLNSIASHRVADAQKAALAADEVGYPVALKLCAPELKYKSDVGGVVLNLNSAMEVVIAAEAMMERVKTTYPEVKVEGLTVQHMAETAGAQELRFTMQCDPVFGPVIMIGEGGSDWDINRDAAVALPPLNMALSRYLMINALKTGKIKDRQLPRGLDMTALCVVLTQIAHLVIDCPEIVSLDINPLLAAGEEITLLDVDIKLQTVTGDGANRLAIRPYPKELEEPFTMRDGREVLLRPILPEDEPSHFNFDKSLSKEDRYKRFFGEVGQLGHEEVAKMTQLDFDREMAFIATIKDAQNNPQTLGVVRAITDPENQETEFAVVVSSDLKGQGLGSKLMRKMIEYCRERDTKIMKGLTLPVNAGMIELSRKLGFKVKHDLEEGWVEMTLDLQK